MRDRNSNSHYVLMTLYGEVKTDDDFELVEKNRRAWNAWSCQKFSDEKAATLAQEARIEFDETRCWAELSTEIKATHKAEMVARNASGFDYPGLPDVNRTIDFAGGYAFDQVDMNSYIFSKALYCIDAEFIGRADFSGSVFSETSLFIGTTFNGNALFSGTKFMNNAYFRETIFVKGANFFNATFERVADFEGAEMHGRAWFNGEESQDPSNSYLGTESNFSHVHFHKTADFSFCKFGTIEKVCKELNFANAIFEGPVSFEGAIFPHRLPILSNTTLPHSTKVTAEDSHWPPVPGPLNWLTGRIPFRNRQKDSEIKESASALRHAMARQMLPEEEHFFFRREMHAAARCGPQLQGWFTRLFFELPSNYGYSIERPIGGLAMLWALGALVFARFTEFGIAKAIGFSGANMLKFLGLQRTYFDYGMIQNWDGWLQWFAATQTVLAFILLFFLGLGLRTRFRLR